MGDDVFYFDNDAVTTKVLDNNKNELGTLQEYLFEGKTITSGSVTNIKHSGVYKVKGLSGLPSEIPSSQYSILEVKAIGNQDNPPKVQPLRLEPETVISLDTPEGDVTL